MRTRLSTLSFALAIVVAAAMIHATATDIDAEKKLGEKYVFENVTFPDGTVGTIFASMRITRQDVSAVASYFDASDGYLGQYREHGGFASSDADEIRAWALKHYNDRK